MKPATCISVIDMEVINARDERAESLHQSGTGLGHLAEKKILSLTGYPVKMHLDFELPLWMNYNLGDYSVM